MPDILLHTSSELCRYWRSVNPGLHCAACSEHRYKIRETTVSLQQEASIEESVLLLLPFSLEESVEILEKTEIILPEIPSHLTVFIKGHPDYSPSMLRRAYGDSRWPSRFRISEQPLSALFPGVRFVISANTSSIVEAAALGIPVIIVGLRTGVMSNPLAICKFYGGTVAFTPEELKTAVHKVVHLSPKEKEAGRIQGKQLGEWYFGTGDDPDLEYYLKYYVRSHEGNSPLMN